MKRLFIAFLGLSGIGGMIGCAHSPHLVDGSIAKSEIPAGTLVRVGSTEVTEGDRLSVLKEECRWIPQTRGGRKRSCTHNKKIGEAVVLKVLDHDSAVVRPENGLTIESSMRVEKVETTQK